MGLSAFNAMRARLAKMEAEKVETDTVSTIKVTEVEENKPVEEPVEKTEVKPRKKTDAEKLKKE